MRFRSLNEFIDEVGPQLEADRTVADARVSNYDPCAIPGFADLRRKPKGAQSLAILGGLAALSEFGYHILNANTGCGKTYMAIAQIFADWTARNRPVGNRWLVVIPPNGIRDWLVEIFSTFPTETVRVAILGHFGKGSRGKREGSGWSDRSGIGCVELDAENRIVAAKGSEGDRFTLEDLRRFERGDKSRLGFLEDDKLTIFLVTRERAKRGPAWERATVKKRVLLPPAKRNEARQELINVPHRAAELNALAASGNRKAYLERRLEGLFEVVETNPDTGKVVRALKSKPSFDGKTPLWQYGARSGYVWPVARYVARHLGGFFEGVVVDEVHEYNNDSEQGAAIGRLIRPGVKFIGLSATLSNGTVQSFQGLLNRLAPKRMNALGYGPNVSAGAHRFVKDFGIEERITTTLKLPNGKVERRQRWREGGGILPHFQMVGLTDAGPLSNFTTFLDLDDVITPQPISYETRLFEVSGKLLDGFDDLHRQFTDLYRNARLNHRFGQKHLQNWALSTLANYLDNPRGWTRIGRDDVWVTPQNLVDEEVSEKEADLVNDIRAEIAAGRRTMVYVDFTSFGVVERIQSVLERAGIPSSRMKADVPPGERDEWLQKVVSAGRQVVITNPELTKTGNLIDFHTAIFFQSSNPRVITRIQAAARYLRVTSTKPVRILYYAWKGTVQEAILERTGRKVIAINFSQGRYLAEAMATWGEGTDDLFRQVMESPETISSTKIWDEIRRLGAPPPPVVVEPPLAVVDVTPETEGVARQLQASPCGKKGKKQGRKLAGGQMWLFNLF